MYICIYVRDIFYGVHSLFYSECWMFNELTLRPKKNPSFRRYSRGAVFLGDRSP